PGAEFFGALAHALLHIDALVLVTRESEIELGQEAAAVEIRDLVLVEKIAGAMLVAEEQPVAALGPDNPPLLEEGAERRDTGARPDHDHRRVVVLRQAEA